MNNALLEITVQWQQLQVGRGQDWSPDREVCGLPSQMIRAEILSGIGNREEPERRREGQIIGELRMSHKRGET